MASHIQLSFWIAVGNQGTVKVRVPLASRSIAMGSEREICPEFTSVKSSRGLSCNREQDRAAKKYREETSMWTTEQNFFPKASRRQPGSRCTRRGQGFGLGAVPIISIIWLWLGKCLAYLFFFKKKKALRKGKQILCQWIFILPLIVNAFAS